MPDYFTLAELRALPDMGDAAKYPNARVEAAAAHIVSIIERETGTSFITRTTVDEPHDGGCRRIVLDESYPRALISVTEAGEVVPGASLDLRGGVLRRDDREITQWASGFSNVLVSYDHGYSEEPPPDIKEAALKGTRLHLLATATDSSANARRSSLSTDMGVESYVIAGEDRPTGYPEIDATILGWKRTVYVPKAR